MRARFTSGLLERFPGFEATRVDSPLIFSGESVFEWRRKQGFRAFVLLVPNATGHQSFTVEVGWSRLDRFPEAGMRPSVILGPDDAPPLELEEGIVRLGGLADRTDVWWELPDPAMQRPGSLDALTKSTEPIPAEVAVDRAEAPVTEALEMLGSAGVPFLEQVIAAQLGTGASPSL